MSRPSIYSEETAQAICDQLMDGQSLRQICSADEMPSRSTVVRWMLSDAEFAARCARAREEQADLMDDRILEAVNRVEAGDMAPDAARVVLSGLQWRAAKLKPKKYGERQAIDLDARIDHYVVRAPEPAKDASEWLKSTDGGAKRG